MLQPGDCSPSRSVVSKMMIRSDTVSPYTRTQMFLYGSMCMVSTDLTRLDVMRTTLWNETAFAYMTH